VTDRPEQPIEVVDPTTGRPILMAPQRQKRPLLTAESAAAPCPFCPGNEAETPPEIDAIRIPGTLPDRPGWRARAFPNKYPAHRHHEVIAEGEVHAEQAGDLPIAAWRDVIVLWQRRVRALEARPGVACAFVFKNSGAPAGASIAHNHSQILGLSALPPRLVLELAQAAKSASCPWCATSSSAHADGRIVCAANAHLAIVPDPPKLPYETWVLPTRCDDDFLGTDVDSLAVVLHGLFVAIRDALHRPAFNLWLHRVPGERFHWHFELQPRTGQMAGLELGGDMYINSVPARTAVVRLRGAQRAR
jgi:UDPglucose--hexose-1-phosphate uridylyltransferase